MHQEEENSMPIKIHYSSSKDSMPFPVTNRLQEKHVDKNSQFPQLAFETEIRGESPYSELQ
jgi:hypothetical protein